MPEPVEPAEPGEPANGPAPIAPTDGPTTGNRRAQALALVVFAALLVAVVVVVVAGRPKHEMSTVAGAEQTKKLLAGLEQHGTTLGKPDAPVTIIEILDLQCPYCAAHQADQQPAIIDRVVRTGKAKITIEPLAFLGADSEVGRNVFLRLAAKNHGWDFLNRAFLAQHAENTGYITDEWLRAVTAGIPGITAADLARGRDATVAPGIAHAEALKRQLMKLGDGTPFFAVGRTGQPLSAYRKVDPGAKGSAAESLIAAVNATAAP